MSGLHEYQVAASQHLHGGGDAAIFAVGMSGLVVGLWRYGG